jgi:rRNA pseudouridine-1189 N-methylase Emg1 (Nep1/Mra1 family)
MYFILADSELELIPEELKGDEDVRRFLRTYGKETALLDNHLMAASIRKHYPGLVNRIGFPHIAYAFSRLNEETVLNERMKIEYAIHTKNNVIIERSELRNVGAGYIEFVERVETLLQSNIRRMSLKDYVDSKGVPGNTVVLHPKGVSGLVINDQLNYVIGGFPEGDFKSDLGNLRKFSIHEREITVPAVLELLHFRLFQS